MQKLVYVLVSAAVSQALVLLNLFAPLFGVFEAVRQFRRGAAAPALRQAGDTNARKMRR